MRNPPLLLLLLFPPALCDRHDAESRSGETTWANSTRSAGHLRLHSANVDGFGFGLGLHNDDADELELAAIPLPPPASVPTWTQEWLCDGRAWLVFQLACVYTAKDSGYKDPKQGWLTGGGEHGRDRVQVTVPPPVSRNFTVEHVMTIGGTYTNAVIYFEKSPDLDTYYVVCQSSKALQLPEILSDWSAASPRTWEESGTVISMSDYIAKKSQNLWSSKYNLGQVLLNLAQDSARPQRYIFCGMSHGAALAEVTSLRFRIKLLTQEPLQADPPDVYALGWNGYRWTNAAGADLTEAFLGDRSVLLINSMRRKDGKIRTDPVTGYFPKNTHVHHRFLLDDEGQVRKCQSTAKQSCPYDIGTGFFGNLQRFSFFSAEKVARLHPYGKIKPGMLLWMQRECGSKESQP